MQHKAVYLFVFFVQLPPPNVAKLTWTRWREAAAQYSMTSIGCCSYSFV